MAIMIPDRLRQETVSKAERVLFNRFRRELDDNCFVLHSLGLTNHKNKIWGQCDFVVLSSLGIFVLEVKGGRVECHGGKWYFTRADGAVDEKTEGPFEQAAGAMYAVREEIEAYAHLHGCLYGYGVLMPDELFNTTGPEIELAVLLDSRDRALTLDRYIQRLHNFWISTYNEKHRHSPKLPSKKDLETICSVLRPEIQTALNLASSINNIDRQLLELTEEQARTVRGLKNNPRCIIEGGAGTGKTVLATDYALKLAEQGQNVLYLCFNRLLGQHVKEHISHQPQSKGKVVASSIHSFYHDVISEAGMINRLDMDDASEKQYFHHIYPSAYIDALLELNKPMFDTVVIDEAQDLMTHEHLDAIDLSIKGGLDSGKWIMFLDPNQNIYGTEANGPLQRLGNYGYASFELTINCRNTQPVAVATSVISGIDTSLDGAIEGGHQEVIFYNDISDMQKRLNKLVDSLLKEGLNRSDIIILSAHTLDKSSISSADRIAGLPVSDLSRDQSNRHGIDFCTMHSFKGLERKAVIAIDVYGLDEHRNELIHYCGLSRAKVWITVLMPDPERPFYDNRVSDFAIRMADRTRQNL